MKKSDLTDSHFLRHITDAIRKLERHREKGETYFLSDEDTQDAVVRNFEIIGEAANNLTDVFKAKYPAIGWRQIYTFRNLLAHGYFEVDYKRVWLVIVNDLPKLKKSMDEILKQEEKKDV